MNQQKTHRLLKESTSSVMAQGPARVDLKTKKWLPHGGHFLRLEGLLNTCLSEMNVMKSKM